MDKQRRAELALQIVERWAKDLERDSQNPATFDEIIKDVDELIETTGCSREEAEEFLLLFFPGVRRPVRIPARMHGSPLNE